MPATAVIKADDAPVGIHGYRVDFRKVANHQRDRMAVLLMKVINGLQIDVRYDIPVDDHERVRVPEVADIVNCSARAQNPGFITGLNGDGIALPGQKCLDVLMQMMGIDHNGPAPGPNQALNGSVQQRYAVYGKQGLGNVPGMRKQTCAQTRA